MTRPRAWLAWSSGKDSAWALHEARRAGEVDVVGLLTTYTEPHDRVSMHGVRVELVRAQADAVGLPLALVPIPAPCSDEIYEARMTAAMDAARAAGVTHVVFGDLFLADVRAYREAQLARAAMTPVFPLWGKPTGALVREMLDAGTAGPAFARRIAVTPGVVVERDGFVFADLRPA